MHVISSVDMYIFENIIMTDMMTVIVILLQYFNFRMVNIKNKKNKKKNEKEIL